MTNPDSQDVSSEAPSPGRSAALGAVGALLLSVPFFVFGLAMADLHARVQLHCAPSGPCTLTRSGWLSEKQVGRYSLDELRGTRVERNRKSATSDVSVWRPVLETSRGDVPLSYAWMRDEARARQASALVERFLAGPRTAPLHLSHDDRTGSGRLGSAFVVVGAFLVAFATRLALRARALLRSSPPA